MTFLSSRVISSDSVDKALDTTPGAGRVAAPPKPRWTHQVLAASRKCRLLLLGLLSQFTSAFQLWSTDSYEARQAKTVSVCWLDSVVMLLTTV
ncbi:hypothetical protein BaRGS_00015956, partial [Batillaria attramentaria]